MSFVTCELMGRMGNQLFQVATTIGIARWFNVPAYFPENPFGLETLPAGYQVQKEWRETEGQKYQDIPFMGESLRLIGYFQKESYFSPAWPEIRKIFQDYFIRVNNRPIKIEKGVVSIHVRLGDYQTYTDYFAQLNGQNYYRKAIEQFPKYTHFKVYSDDIEQAKGMFLGNNFEFAEGGTPESDLWDMSLCEHNIIANSSFSWWASMLNVDHPKKIIAPRLWFQGKNAHLDTNGLYSPLMTII